MSKKSKFSQLISRSVKGVVVAASLLITILPVSTAFADNPGIIYPSLAQTVTHGPGILSRRAPDALNIFSQTLFPPCTSSNVYDLRTVSTQTVAVAWSGGGTNMRGAGSFTDTTVGHPGEFWSGTPEVSGDPAYTDGGFTDSRKWTTIGPFSIDSGGALATATYVVGYKIGITLTAPASTQAPALNARVVLEWRNVPNFDIATSSPTFAGVSCDGSTPVLQPAALTTLAVPLRHDR